MPEDDAPPRVVICGDNTLASRLVTELMDRYGMHCTVIMPSDAERQAPEIAEIIPVSSDPALLPRIMVAPRLTEEVLRDAGVAETVALALVDQDDVANVNAAFIAREINDRVRIVIRMYNQLLGDGIAELLGDCAALSGSEIAAPAFVATALGDNREAYVRCSDEDVLTAVTRSPETRSPETASDQETSEFREDLLCGLAITRTDGEPEALPDDEYRADLVLIRTSAAALRGSRRPRQPLIPLLRLALGRQQRWAFLAVLFWVALGGAVLSAVARIGLWKATYLATLIAVGSGNPSPEASVAQQITEILLAVAGIAIVPILTAIVVEAVVRARLAANAPGVNRPISGHVIVAGLGNVGTRVMRELNDLGLEVVGIDQSETARGVPVARALGITVICGPANSAEILRLASVETCRTLLALSTDDVANLETALLARNLHAAHQRELGNPPGKLRILMRLFDEDFANRIKGKFDLDLSRSVSYLAAPAFAAAMMGKEVLGTIPVGRRVLLVAELTIGAGSQLDGVRCEQVDQSGQVRLISIKPRNRQVPLWRWSPRRVLVRTERIMVVATRSGLVGLLDRTAPAEHPPPPPELPRLLVIGEQLRRQRREGNHPAS